MSLTQELTNFNVCNSLQLTNKRKRRESNSSGPDNAPTLSGKLLLDSGAIGRCVVSKAFHRRLAKSKFKFECKQVNNNLMTALNDHTLTNKEIIFNIQIISENKNVTKPVTIPITAIVAKINIDLVIDKDTIKRFNLAYHCVSNFADGDLKDSIQSLPKPEEGPMCGAKPPSGVDKTTWVNATLSIAHNGIKTH